MRISDWSSDVCSSDLFAEHAVWRSVLDQKREIITRFDAAPLIFRHGYMGRFAEGTGTAEINAEPTAAQSDFVLGHRRDLEIIHRSEEHTSELQSLMRISYAVFCLKQKNQRKSHIHTLNRKHK